MANFTDSNTWGTVTKLETSTPVLGGPENSPANTPLSQLNNRAFYLYTWIAGIVAGTIGILGKLLNGSTCLNAFSSPQQYDTAVPTTAFVQDAISNRSGRNKILNGNMKIAQRGTSFLFNANRIFFTLDRWLCALGSGSRTATLTQENQVHHGILLQTDNVMRLVMSSGTGTFTIKQRIASVLTFENGKAILQFVLNTANVVNIDVSLSQFLTSAKITSNHPEWTTTQTVIGHVGCAVYTLIFNIPALAPSDVVPGSIDSSNCLELCFSISDTAAQDIWLGNVQIEAGTIASAFEVKDDFNECLGYYEYNTTKENSDEFISGGTSSSSSYRREFCAKKRITPTVMLYNTVFSNCSTLTVTDIQINSAQVKCIVSATPWNFTTDIEFNSEIQ